MSARAPFGHPGTHPTGMQLFAEHDKGKGEYVLNGSKYWPSSSGGPGPRGRPRENEYPLARYLRETAIFPIHDAGTMRMQQRRIRGVTADPNFNPDAFRDS